MKTLNCLYFEDEEDEYLTLHQMLIALLKPISLNFTHVSSVATALEIINKGAEGFHIFIADILTGPKRGGETSKRREGLFLAAEAAKIDDLLVLAISHAEQTFEGIGAKTAFESSGGHLFIAKKDIREPSENPGIKNALLEHMEKMDWYSGIDDIPRLSNHCINEIETNVKLRAAVETIGRCDLRRLIGLIRKSSDEINLSYISQGYSGAIVLRVETTERDGKSLRPFLIKLSMQSNKLKLELDRAPRIDDLTSHIYVNYFIDKGVVSVKSGWHAISALFEENAITFEQWICVHKNEHDLREILNSLFLAGLKNDYDQGHHASKRPIDFLLPDDKTCAVILSALDDLNEVIAKVSSKNDLKFVIPFVQNDGQIGMQPANKMPDGTWVCKSHGDLHLRNILVREKDNRPVLVDTGNRGDYHWARDPAKFSANLWIVAWDAGVKSHFWDNWRSWCDQIKKWSNMKGKSRISLPAEDNPNFSTAIALSWLSGNFNKLFPFDYDPAKHHWEYELALAIEFLKLCSYASIPTPKRVVAAISANEILRRLDKVIPWR